MRIFWYVAFGAAAGGLSRYYLTGYVQQHFGAGFPLGTLLINISGSVLLGFLMRYALTSGAMSPETRILLTTGYCGGYTTFSTFTYEAALLMEEGEIQRAALYVALSVFVALLGTFVGFGLAQGLLRLREGT